MPTVRKTVLIMSVGNTFVPGFIADFNGRFGKSLVSPHNLHRPMLSYDMLEDAFKEDKGRDDVAQDFGGLFDGHTDRGGVLGIGHTCQPEASGEDGILVLLSSFRPSLRAP